MQVDLSGLRALVTGSTKGIGRAIARELAANGAEVVINGRKAADTEQAIVSLRATLPNGRFKAAPGDAGTAAGVASIIEAAGDVDILVNNVGVFEIKDAFDIPGGCSPSMCSPACGSPGTTGRACVKSASGASSSSHRNPACKSQPR